MKNKRRVVGNNPMFYKLNDLESIDIDDEFDFELAELFYRKKVLREI